MINVIVSYHIPTEFVETNKMNIEAFLKDFKNLNQSQFSYKILQKEDEQSFVHISKYKNTEIQKQLLNIPSFIEFQKQRDESCDNIQQKIEVLNFVGNSGNF